MYQFTKEELKGYFRLAHHRGGLDALTTLANVAKLSGLSMIPLETIDDIILTMKVRGPANVD